MADQTDNININIGSDATGVEAGSRRAKTAINSVQNEAKGLDAAFRRLQSAIDPTFAAQERYNRSLEENRKLLAAGRISGQEFAAGMKAATTELENARAAAVRNTDAYKQQQAAARSSAAAEATAVRETANAAKIAAREKAQAEMLAAKEAAAAARQKAVEEKAAIAEAAAAAKAAAREKAQAERQAAQEGVAAEKAARQQSIAAAREAARAAADAAKQRVAAERLATTAAREAAEAIRRQAVEERGAARAAQELRASIDPAFAAQMRYNDTMARATTLLMQNKLQTGEWTKIQQQAKAQMDVNVRTMGRFNSAYVQLGYQAQDVTASLASGINPLVILAQQGGQTAAALSTFGGTVGRVATFMAGPWGAAILGAVTVLGLLIPKLLDASSASDQMARSQENLKNYVDSTTGSIKAQITETQRLAAAQNEQEGAEAKRKDATKSRDRLADQATLATRGIIGPRGMQGAAEGFGTVASSKSRQQIDQWSEALKNADITSEQFMQRMRGLAKTDVDVRLLTKSLTDVAQKSQDAEMAARLLDAESRRFLGTMTAEDKELVGSNDSLSQSYLNAQATIKTTTDTVTRARAKQTVAEEDAERVRKTARAAGTPEKAANDAYIKSVAPYIQAVEKAEEARSAASAAASAGRRAERKEESEAHKAELEALRFKIETYDFEREAAVDSYTEQVRIQNLKIDALRQYYGAESNEVVRAQRDLQRMERQHNQELLSIQREKIAAQADIEVDRLNAQREIQSQGQAMAGDQIDTMASVGQLDGRPLIEARRQLLEQEYAMQVDFENRIYQLKIKSLQDQLALLPIESRERAGLNTQIEVMQAQHENTMAVLAAQNTRAINKTNLDVINNSVQKWKTATDSIASSFSQMFQGIWMHSGNFKQNLLNIADQLVFKFVDVGLKIASDWAANELTKTAAAIAGNQARTAAATAGAAAQTTVGNAAATAEIGARAATSAAGAYSSTVIIPFIGPVAAPAAAALALAAVMGFGALISAKGGMGEVPDDQLAMVHKKEMILPAWIAEPFRQGLKNSPRANGSIGNAMMAGADARSATHMSATNAANFYYQPQHTNMGAGFDTLLQRDGSSLRRWLRNEVRKGSLRMGS